MRNRIFGVLAIAILAGGGLAYGTYNMMNNQPVKTVTTPTQPVVVAAADLEDPGHADLPQPGEHARARLGGLPAGRARRQLGGPDPLERRV